MSIRTRRYTTVAQVCGVFRAMSDLGRARAASKVAPTPVAASDNARPTCDPGQTFEIKRFLSPQHSRPTRHEWWFRFVTRTVDIVVAGGALLVFSPLILLVALAIAADSPGPILFSANRAWMNRRKTPSGTVWNGIERRSVDRHVVVFNLLKFRTMYADSHIRFPSRYAYDYSEEQLRTLPMKALLAAESGPEAQDTLNGELGTDPRLTRVGRWLRRTSLDELPNLINVLRGQMSLVGGRPELFGLVGYYMPESLRKFDMKPGVTGLAQVLGRGNLTFHQINAYDAEYVTSHSLRLYFWILWRTGRVVCTGEGAF